MHARNCDNMNVRTWPFSTDQIQQKTPIPTIRRWSRPLSGGLLSICVISYLTVIALGKFLNFSFLAALNRGWSLDIAPLNRSSTVFG